MDGALTSRRTSRARRGAASVEAVILLPVFIVLLFAVRHSQGKYLAILGATASARECAFAYAADGCRSVPARCGRIVGPAGEDTSDALSQQVDREASVALGQASRVIDAFGKASTFPILGEVLGAFFGKRIHARAERSFQAHLPGEAATYLAIGRHTLVCNVPVHDGPIADELFRVLTGGL